MRALLLLLAVISASAAAYFLLFGDGGRAPALGAGACAVIALVLFKLGSPGAAARSSQQTRQHSPSSRDEASALAGNLATLAAARASKNSEALDSRGTVAVYLTSVGPNTIAVIKVLREYLRLGLKEAKDLTDSANLGQKPSLGQTIPSAVARNLERDISRAGGQVEIR